MQGPKDAANPSSRPYSLTSVLIKGAARRGNFGLLPLPDSVPLPLSPRAGEAKRPQRKTES